MLAYEKMMKALKTSGFRLTPQRQAICRYLVDHKDHPSAQMIYDKLRADYNSLSLATVYNTLDALSRLGLINVLGEVGVGEAVRYDSDVEPHINVACVRCHRILDIDSPYVQHMEQDVVKSSGFRLIGSRVLYYGLCPECQPEEQQPS